MGVEQTAAALEQKFNAAFPYKEVRPQQASIMHALGSIYAQPRFRYVVIEAGTGVGKSGIAKAIAGVEGRAFLLTATKQLQDQYMATFDDGTMAVLKGKANYRCAVDSSLTCAYGACMASEDKDGQEQRRECYAAGRCPYRNALNTAEHAKVVVMSYAMFMSMMRLADTARQQLMESRPVLIIDECHLLEDQLVTFAGFELSQAMLDKKYHLLDMTQYENITSPFEDQLEQSPDYMATMTKYVTSIDLPYMEEGFAGDEVYPHRTANEGKAACLDWLRLVAKLLTRRLQLVSLQLDAVNNDARRWSMTADQLTFLNGLDKRKLAYEHADIQLLLQKLEAYLSRYDDKKKQPVDDDWLLTVRDPKASSRPKPKQYTKATLKVEQGKHRDGYRVAVQPLDVDKLFGMFMDKFAVNHVVFMSATIIDKQQFCNDLGLSSASTALVSRPSTFDAYRSPIVIDPMGSMSREYMQRTVSNMIGRINDILREHAHEKGLIHTTSMLLARTIYDNIAPDLRGRLLIAEGMVNNEQLLMQHKSTRKPTVLISPSMMAGVDLEDDFARFQVVAKFPFASLGDPRVAKKMNRRNGKSWYKAKMLRSFVQECGRGTRSEEDWCVTYVLDGYVEYLMRNDMDKFDDQFKQRMIYYTKFNLNDWRQAMTE